MGNSLRLNIGRYMIPIPCAIWQRQVARQARAMGPRLEFMSPDHHRVRDFAVTELPRVGGPLRPELIAERLGLPLARVQTILDELEREMTFLYRDEQGAVTWAYPVTVDSTPHHLTFETGERMTAA